MRNEAHSTLPLGETLDLHPPPYYITPCATSILALPNALFHSRGSALHKAYEDDRQAGRFLGHARSRVTSRRCNSILRLPAAAVPNEGEIFYLANPLSPCISHPAQLFPAFLSWSVLPFSPSSPSFTRSSVLCTCPGSETPLQQAGKKKRETKLPLPASFSQGQPFFGVSPLILTLYAFAGGWSFALELQSAAKLTSVSSPSSLYNPPSTPFSGAWCPQLQILADFRFIGLVTYLQPARSS